MRARGRGARGHGTARGRVLAVEVLEGQGRATPAGSARVLVVVVVFGVERHEQRCGRVQLHGRRVGGGSAPQQPGRMRGRVDGLELADAHLRVDLRRREFGVPEDRLDVAYVGAVLGA